MYLGLSCLLVLSLVLAGMPLFDSVLHSFSTMSTGGFSPKNISIAAYNSASIDAIITVFMFIAGMNFVLIYWFIHGDFKRLFRYSEFKFYLLLNATAIVLITLELRTSVYPSILESLRYVSFQVLSISTTTGFATENFDLWPSFAKWFLLLLMFFGACAGSTAGGIKIIRTMVLFKKGHRELQKIIYPRAVVPVRIDNKPVSDDIMSSITSFFLLYLFIYLFGTLVVMAAEDISLVTAISACAATLGNIGPGLGEVGPAGNYANLTSTTKVVLSFLMLTGRLELFTILVLITPAFWKK